jgi:hypothetical protein
LILKRGLAGGVVHEPKIAARLVVRRQAEKTERAGNEVAVGVVAAVDHSKVRHRDGIGRLVEKEAVIAARERKLEGGALCVLRHLDARTKRPNGRNQNKPGDAGYPSSCWSLATCVK